MSQSEVRRLIELIKADPTLLHHLEEDDLSMVDTLVTRATAEEVNERCARLELGAGDVASEEHGCLYWLQNCTATTDDHWQTKGTPARAPFPRKSYLRYLVGALLHLAAHPEEKTYAIFVPKSRDVMCSWTVMGVIAWMCQFRPQTFWVAQSAKEDKAAELITYARTLYHNQSESMRQLHPLAMDNQLEVRWTNGSRLLGVPAGEDQIRIHHPFGWFADEAAFLPNFAECFNAVRPVASQIVAISTASPGFFGDECTSPAVTDYKPTGPAQRPIVRDTYGVEHPR